MEEKRLTELAKEMAALAVELRILGRGTNAWDLVQIGEELERAVVEMREVVEGGEVKVEEGGDS